MRVLRFLLVLDSAVLFLLGVSFIFLPQQVLLAFHFRDLPVGVNYLIGLWGCVFATLAMGYFFAAMDPIRNIVWVQVGIARGALECLLGVFYMARGVVTFPQAGFGIIVAALITAAYIIWYPRRTAASTPT